MLALGPDPNLLFSEKVAGKLKKLIKLIVMQPVPGIFNDFMPGILKVWHGVFASLRDEGTPLF